MCDSNGSKPNVFSVLESEPAKPAILISPTSTQSGSRRRRLWELPSQALCPVIGVCLPMPLLRRRIDKQLGGSARTRPRHRN